ncbi:hypothetical protein R6Q57_008349 [Mikania cordata]
MRITELFTNFEFNIESVLICSVFTKLEEVDILVIPILQDIHYYLLCFNFKKATIDIIDNMKGKLKPNQNYHISRTREVVLLYLEKYAPSFFKKLEEVKPTKIEFPWQTKNNFVECGVFAMRHMETYQGKPITDWAVDCGLKAEDEGGLKDQLNELRIKYLSKILLSDLNVLNHKVLSQMQEYEKIDKSEREKMKKTAHKRILQRMKKS